MGRLVVITIPTTAAAQVEQPTPESTTWHLVSYAAGIERTQVPWFVDATWLLKEGEAIGSAGCSGFVATYEVDAEAITFSHAGTTDVVCPDAWMDVRCWVPAWRANPVASA